jgi:hypothetical protein
MTATESGDEDRCVEDEAHDSRLSQMAASQPPIITKNATNQPPAPLRKVDDESTL